MTPIVDGLEQDYGDQVTIVRLNAIERDVLALQQRYGVQGHPSFVVLDAGGTVVARFFGPQSREALEAALQQVQ